jgi:tetratricopeptide (TPR) repeat protein
MTDPRNIPPDLALADWDTLLEGVEGPSPAAPTPQAPPSVPPQATPSAPYVTPSASPPAGSAKTAPPPLPSLHPPSENMVFAESYEDEDERTVVGEVPRELLNSTRSADSPSYPPQPFFPVRVDPLAKSSRSSTDDDRSVVTSAREISVQRRPAPPPPRPAAGRPAGDAGLTRPAARQSDPPSPFEDRFQPVIPRPPAMPTPVGTRALRGRPSSDVGATPPAPVAMPTRGGEDAPYGQGPQLFSPIQRDYSPEDATGILDLHNQTALRAVLEAAQSAPFADVPTVAREHESVAPSFDVSVSLPPAAAESEGQRRPTVRPEALNPTSPPAPTNEAFWSDERPALAFLDDAKAVDAWRERAAWLADEARRRDDGAARAGLLLTVSELWSMTGDDELAAEAAAEAIALAPQQPFAHRQARAGAARNGDAEAMLRGLDAEARVAPSPQARAHAAFVGAEICRATGDREGASKRLDQAARAHPADPRPHVVRAAPVFGEPGPAPQHRWADSMALAPFVHASTSLAAMRGAFDQAPRSLYEALPRARVAWAEGRVGATAEALAALQQLRTIGEGALWLASTLAACDREARAKVIEPLEVLQNGPHPVLASRALADAKLELGDVEGARAIVTVGRTFTDAEQVAFGALTQAPSADLAAALSELSALPECAALAVAVESIVDRDAASFTVGDPASRSLAALGRALARDEADLETRMLDVAAANADGSVVRALELETHAESGAVGDLAVALAAWPTRHDTGLDEERDRALAAALVYEFGGASEQALEEAHRALELDPASEAAARICLAHDNDSAPALLEALAAREGDTPLRGALWLIEAALRRTERGENVQELLERAHELAPDLPFASALGSRLGRAAGDLDAVLRWVRRRRDASDDLVETAHELVREALLVAGEDESLAASLLDQACVARPEDVALRDLFDRLSPEPRADRPAWLAARADASEGASRARFALQAAWAFEQQGDLERAAHYAALADEAGPTPLAGVVKERLDALGPGAAAMRESLIEAARNAPTKAEEREAYEKLAELDAGPRRDPEGSLLWHRSILEIDPASLPSLRRLEHSLVAEGREDDLEPLFADLAKYVDGAEAAAHARAAARLRLRVQPWENTQALVERAASAGDSNLWALRQLFAHARARGDHAGIFRAARALGYETDQPFEQAALFFRAAEAAAGSDRRDEALELVAEVLDRVPEYAPAHLLQVELLVQGGAYDRAALALEEAAASSRVRAHQARFYHHAATLWLDQVGDRERGTAALESAVECDPGLESALARLQALYVETGERAKLALLLERRLQGVTDPAERARFEIERGRALAEVGDIAAAKLALSAALEQNPDDEGALHAFVDVCAREGDLDGVERGLLHLVRLAPGADAQVELYRRLGRFYESERPDAARAEASYAEVLRRAPDDEDARERLVAIFLATGDHARALNEQQALVSAAGDDAASRRRRVVELARLHEEGGDPRKAEATLEGLRKEAPHDALVLRALAEFHLRRGNAPAANMLLDRTAADARRALVTGRFDLHFFANLTTVFELRGRPDAARVASATLAALEGRPCEADGRGARALAPALDDLIAPELFTPAFRHLLRQAGDALDGATGVDLRGLRAQPLPPDAENSPREAYELAQALGLGPPQLYVAPGLGAVCLPAASSPPTLVLGPSLLGDQHREVRLFLLVRALKILQGHVAAFARTAPIELWPLVAAFLQSFAPQWQPQGVDPNKLQDYHARIQRSMPGNLSNDASVLALEVISSLGNRASTLQTSSNAWGNRCALLALGDMSTALSAIATAAGLAGGPPAGGPERLTWVGRNAEARDLVIYSVSDAFFEARSRA